MALCYVSPLSLLFLIGASSWLGGKFYRAAIPAVQSAIKRFCLNGRVSRHIRGQLMGAQVLRHAGEHPR